VMIPSSRVILSVLGILTTRRRGEETKEAAMTIAHGWQTYAIRK